MVSVGPGLKGAHSVSTKVHVGWTSWATVLQARLERREMSKTSGLPCYKASDYACSESGESHVCLRRRLYSFDETETQCLNVVFVRNLYILLIAGEGDAIYTSNRQT